MVWIAVAVVGGNVINGIIGANASKGAADTQAQSAAQSLAAQQAMFDQTTKDVAPWLTAGQNSLAKLSAGVENGTFNPTAYTQQTPLSTYTATGWNNYAAAPSLQKGIGLPAQNNGVSMAPSLSNYGPSANMSTVAPAAQQQAYDQYVAQNPYQSGGAFTADKFQQDPGYQFQLQQGLDALTNKSSLAGGMNSNNMKGLIGYAQGMANTDYQQAFQNYQTEQNRGLNEYQTGLQDYIQQFMVGQTTNGLNNQVLQNNFNNQLSGTAFNNAATQTNNQNAIQTTGLNNQVIDQNLTNQISAQGFNNQTNNSNLQNLMAATTLNNGVDQQNFANSMASTGYNNSVTQQNFNNQNQNVSLTNQVIGANNAAALQVQGLNNQNLQQEYANLSSLSQAGMGAALQQGQIGSNVGQSIGNTMVGAGNAKASGQIGVANALSGGIGGAYNAWLQSQYLNPSSGSNFLNSNSSILNQGLTPADLISIG